MASGLETAAGAFAIVGVADVILRTGKAVYSFLADVSDAPLSMNRLRESIHDTTVLALACKESLKSLKTRAQSVGVTGGITPFNSALRAVNRELQSLNLIIGRFRGSNKTWDKVKFTLEERKIEKAVVNLERSKSLLANALIVAYG